MRPKLLTPELVDRLVMNVELGLSLEAAARAADVSPRSLRRWRRDGESELEGLSVEARLALALKRVRPLESWEEIARQLEYEWPEHWAPERG